jgi:very-short-patch-repair endonuclease/KaiC/GvpD/RAD55 family RecA-like ATPase
LASDRLQYRLDQWKRQLIDLTRRNRLLNYKPTKASTVEIVDELPQLVLERLQNGDRFLFDPVPDPTDEDPGPFEGEEGEEAPLARNLDTGRTHARMRPADVQPYHEDDRLQTTLPKKRLDGNLLAIYRRAEESIEEQGVNSLFLAIGMLEWREKEDSGVANRAPLIMVPVSLERRTAASAFALSAGEDDPMLNPAIVEKLKLEFGIQLPDLPEIMDELDLDAFYEKILSAVEGFRQWRITSDIALGLFSFQKFIMYRDIERHEDRFREHRVVRVICREGDRTHAPEGLPRDVAEADLDREMSPQAAIQVMDADSSQQRAILAVRKGNDLVIEGPPGTGKSQTITNLIADALARGTSVLFVAEKKAALEVVKSRLEHDAGLGDYVLELHSNKTSKREFVETLTKSLDRNGETNGSHETELARLRAVTETLRQYVTELHRPEAPLERSPFNGIAELASLEDAPVVAAEIRDLDTANQEDFQRAADAVSEMARSIAEIGDPEQHPLRGIGLEHAGRAERVALESTLTAAGGALADLADAAGVLAEMFGLRFPGTFGEAKAMAEGARTLARTPGGDVGVLENRRWNEISAEIEEILATGERYAEAKPEVARHFRPEWMEKDRSADVAEYAAHLERRFGRFFRPTYWSVRGRLRAVLSPGHRPAGAESFLAQLRQAEVCRADLMRIRAADEDGRDLFGGRWSGPASDWADLRAFAEWVVEFRRHAMKDILDAEAARIAAAAEVDRAEADGAIQMMDKALRSAHDTVAAVIGVAHLSPESGLHTDDAASIGTVAARVGAMEGALDDLRPFSAYVAARAAVDKTIAGPFTGAALEAGIEPAQMEAAFRRSFYDAWVQGVLDDRQVLGRFHASQHEDRVETFREMDRRSASFATERARASLAARRAEILSGDLAAQYQLLNHESRKQRRIMPIRKLLARAPGAIQRIKPCFMMSPLSVAQYLDPEKIQFGLVVFDEASQIPPADAIGAIIRAAQVVVVGDSKQLPPTNFFGVHLDDADLPEEEELEMLEDLESILDEAAVSGIPSVRLKWHYRSEHQSLIRFSNEEFYKDEPLYVFPSAVSEADDLGLKFHLVENGVYEGGGQNSVEARVVAEAVVAHIKDTPHLALGVGTFGIKQQQRILDELDRLRREDETIEWFFHQVGDKKFFVKNLENIQGDDRDVIFLSVTYGPDADGIIRRNFGPITYAGGWRRLNVLTTRAKRVLRVFSSMRGDQISVENVSDGVVLLRQYLVYAETGRYPAAKIPGGVTDSPFESAVKQALERQGYRVVAQVGDAGYRIDLAVIDPELAGRYLCGIECDGATYHSALTVRDRDRLRQQVLEMRGWEIHRVWSTDWFHDPKGQIERLLRLIERSRERARNGNGLTPRQPEPAPDPVPMHEPEAEERPRIAVEDIEVPLYRFAPEVIQGRQEAFYTARLGTIARAITEILEVEAPIHHREVCRRVAARWGMQRAGSQIVGRVENALATLARSGVVETDGEFVCLLNGQPVRVRSRGVEDVRFLSEHVAPQEVVEAVRLLLRHRAPLMLDEIITDTARLLGFRHTSAKFRERIVAAKDHLVTNGELRPGSRGIHLAD